MLVDEAQDCDAAEFGILRLLQANGIKVVAVADPDQAIFEFRGGDPALFLAFRDDQPDGAVVHLATNLRSTVEICNAVTALRAAGTASITASDDRACCPVYVLTGTPTEQGGTFEQLLEEHRVDCRNAIVIAHRRADAEAVVGASAPATSKAAGNRLADACARLRPGAEDPARRLAAIKDVEELILAMISWPEELQPAGRDRKLSEIDRRAQWLRQSAASLVAEVRSIETADAFGVRARTVLQSILNPLGVPLLALGPRMKRPTDEVWATCHPAATSETSTSVGSSTIHGVKGREFSAVLVALPNTLRSVNGKTVLDDIEGGVNSEARRVLYVGASRAGELLAFGAGPHADRLALVLAQRGVSIELR